MAKITWTNVGNNPSVDIWEANAGDFLLTVTQTFANVHPYKFFVGQIAGPIVLAEGFAGDREVAMRKAMQRAHEMSESSLVTDRPVDETVINEVVETKSVYDAIAENV